MGFGALEGMVVPAGFQNFAMFATNTGMPALRHLSVTACALTPQGANEMAQLLASLSRPLASLQMDALEPQLAINILDAVLPKGNCKTQRLVFSRCVLLDVTAAQHLGRIMISGDTSCSAPESASGPTSGCTPAVGTQRSSSI